MICKCGNVMTEANYMDIFYCINCDVLQPQQMLGFPRVVSVQDKKFENATTELIKKWYPEQFNDGSK